jgi:UDP-2,3-diacylglucosamine pyrophosphatase LpxH
MPKDYEEMITHKFLGGHDVEIVPVFDVHLGNPFCMEQRFIEFINETKETPNRYLILGGDLIENNLKNSPGSVYEQTIPPHIQKREMANILAPVRDRCLCFVQGNHERRSTRETSLCPLFEIAAKLDLEQYYRDSVAFLAIEMGIKERPNGVKSAGFERPLYSIAVCHGNGGGMLTGSSINRTERWNQNIDGIDLTVSGHTHRPYVTFVSKQIVNMRTRKVTRGQAWNVSATSWLEYGGYASQKMLPPSSFALHKIILHGDKKQIEVLM